MRIVAAQQETGPYDWATDAPVSPPRRPSAPRVAETGASRAAKNLMLETGEDDDLVALVADGDHAAFRVLMARHMNRAIRVAQGVLGVPAEADDVAQEAFLRVWRHAGSFDPRRARFTTWLHRIVVNLAIDRRRLPRSESLELAENLADGAQDALAGLIDDDERRAVARALAQMPERFRAAITLFHFEGLSGRDCARALDIGESAFESLLTRARAALRRSIAGATRNQGRES
ncbi:MAG: RNA polymerase sigma factor [Pseudorhodoplanes sp.]|nr:RNA polymerase sigma factor [Pseudorhodoplanes sp.]